MRVPRFFPYAYLTYLIHICAIISNLSSTFETIFLGLCGQSSEKSEKYNFALEIVSNSTVLEGCGFLKLFSTSIKFILSRHVATKILSENVTQKFQPTLLSVKLCVNLIQIKYSYFFSLKHFKELIEKLSNNFTMFISKSLDCYRTKNSTQIINISYLKNPVSSALLPDSHKFV